MSMPIGPPTRQEPLPLDSPSYRAIGEALLAVDFYLEGSKHRLHSYPLLNGADGWMLASLAEEYNSTFNRLMEIDTDLQTADKDGMDWSEYRAAELGIGGMVAKWLRFCEGLFPVTNPILPAVKRLHDNIREAKAILNPKWELGGQMTTFRDEAIAAYHAGETVDLMEGLDT